MQTPSSKPIHRPTLWATALLCATLAACSTPQAQAADPLPPPPASSSEGFSAGLSVKPEATAADIGLPAYPGAVPSPDADNSINGKHTAGASFALWGGAFGVQLQVLKLRSDDPVDTVARFYGQALARYGEVLDCSTARRNDSTAAADKDKKILRCDNDRAPPGGRLLKVGLPSRARMVKLEPVAGGTRIQLVRLEVRGE